MTITDTASVEPIATGLLPPIRLSLQDRCDRCGAQAFVRVSILNAEGLGSELLFCGHHFSKNAEQLTARATHIQNQTDSINPDSSASPK